MSKKEFGKRTYTTEKRNRKERDYVFVNSHQRFKKVNQSFGGGKVKWRLLI
ncbi:hypothetical protein RGU74_20210 [Bacillus cereus]|uniref:hypothetical protein n=1 Tax=Bacillus cereus TaxID=1396 RepID=UPI00285372B6|nr:hypothetical protein [Bacillus cereus]MDR4985948.1 hypothetical protein [Bacillus cereus]